MGNLIYAEGGEGQPPKAYSLEGMLTSTSNCSISVLTAIKIAIEAVNVEFDSPTVLWAGRLRVGPRKCTLIL